MRRTVTEPGSRSPAVRTPRPPPAEIRMVLTGPLTDFRPFGPATTLVTLRIAVTTSREIRNLLRSNRLTSRGVDSYREPGHNGWPRRYQAGIERAWLNNRGSGSSRLGTNVLSTNDGFDANTHRGVIGMGGAGFSDLSDHWAGIARNGQASIGCTSDLRSRTDQGELTTCTTNERSGGDSAASGHRWR